MQARLRLCAGQGTRATATPPMSLAKWTLLIGWAVVASMCLMLITGLKQIGEAQAEIASLQQEVLEARDILIGQAGADCSQAAPR